MQKEKGVLSLNMSRVEHQQQILDDKEVPCTVDDWYRIKIRTNILLRGQQSE